MADIEYLALIGFIEAIVFLFRYRTASERSPWISALTTMCICTMRLMFVFLGAKAMMEGSSLVWAILAYGGTATITTGILHEILERRKDERAATADAIRIATLAFNRRKVQKRDGSWLSVKRRLKL